MKRKMFTFSAIVAALILLAFYLAPVVTAEDPFASRPHEWTAKQTFRSGMTINAPNSINKAPIVFGANTTLSSAGAATFSGAATFTTIDASGTIYQGLVNQAFTSKTGFVIVGTEGNIFTINGSSASIDGPCGAGPGPTDQVGVTVVLPTPTAALDGAEFTIIKADSGATDLFLYAGGLPIDSASKTTDALTIDAQGDCVVVIADFQSAVSYWIKSSRIH